MKRSSIKEKKQTNGKKEVGPTARTLEELIKGPSTGRFSAKTEEEFKGELNLMNIIDIQREAIRVGLQPHTNRVKMIELLLREFRRDAALVATAGEFERVNSIATSNKVPDELRRFLETIGGNALA
jgi:hypothetical protein